MTQDLAGREAGSGQEAVAGPDAVAGQGAARDEDAAPGQAQVPGQAARPTGVRLGVVGWLRWGWRQLTSMRTALVLLFLLALASIPGSVLPQQGIDPAAVSQYYAAHPALAPFLARLSAFAGPAPGAGPVRMSVDWSTILPTVPPPPVGPARPGPGLPAGGSGDDLDPVARAHPGVGPGALRHHLAVPGHGDAPREGHQAATSSVTVTTAGPSHGSPLISTVVTDRPRCQPWPVSAGSAGPLRTVRGRTPRTRRPYRLGGRSVPSPPSRRPAGGPPRRR